MADMRNPLPYVGGKRFMLKKLLKLLPSDVEYYLEVFGGTAGLLLAKRPCGFEVYNDIDENLVNFYRVLRDRKKFEEFYRLITLTPYARSEYNYAREKLLSGEGTDVERAYWFFVCARLCFGGKIYSSFGYEIATQAGGMSKVVHAYLSAVRDLPQLHTRFRRVQVENLDWEECMDKYNYEWFFAYLDPPYLLNTRKTEMYTYEMSAEEHGRLVEWLLSRNKMKIMLSGYVSDVYSILEENGWRRFEYNVPLSVERVGEGRQKEEIKRSRRTECVWVNYDSDLRIFEDI